MGDIHYINLGKLIFDFENEKSTSISDIKIFKREAWSVIKVPLYFNLLYNVLTLKNTTLETSKKKSNIYFFSIIASFLFFPAKFLFLYITTKRKGLIWLMPMSADKLIKNEKNLFSNVLFDEIASLAKKLNNLYIEIPAGSDYKSPAQVKRDLGTLGLIIPTKILYLLFKYTGYNNKKAIALAKPINIFLSEKISNTSIQIESKSIKQYLDFYVAEYCIYNILLFFLKPTTVIVADQGASGKIGAFLNNDVKVIEMQHGMMDEYYPHYVYSKSLIPRKNQLVVPDQICVFGEFHKNILLKHGFWNAADIVPLGNYRIDYWRNKKVHKAIDKKFNILFPTQWHVFEESKNLLIDILNTNPDIIINIKLHPAEKENHANFYKKLRDEYPKNINLWDRKKDIYELVMESSLVIGFDSTTLLESLALGRPVITLANASAPKGIHSYINSEELVDGIRIAHNTNDLINYIESIKSDANYYDCWVKESLNLGNYLYSNNYKDNCTNFINNI